MKAKKPILSTVILSSITAILLALIVVGNILLPRYSTVISGYLNDPGGIIANAPADAAENVDLEYNKLDYSSKEEMAAAEQALGIQMVAEGAVLLQNKDHNLPLEKGASVSFFGRSCLNMVGNVFASYGGGSGLTLQTAFKDRGFNVNSKLWKFYNKNGKDYGLGTGSISWGQEEDFSIKEMPIDMITSDDSVMKSLEGTVPVFILKRNVGEGRDMPRAMYAHTDIPEDQARSYLEPDSVELGILSYLNDHFDNVVLVVNSTGAMELGWVADYPNIKSVVYVPNLGNDGLYGLADLFCGNAAFSGHTVDTFAYDAFSSPAMANFGDFQYVDETGDLTKYNYVDYLENIYVGYRYYETRYEDYVLEQGNAGDYDYASTVLYPFGYGLSYTDFEWSDFNTQWNGDQCTVSVTVKNTGNVAGKDVVQLYIQKPYTDYDRQNRVEKAAVELAGFTKTGLLQPGESQTISVVLDKSQFKSYDSSGAKTYILDAGTYYITAAHDAHNGINNILAAKGADSARMTSTGDAALAAAWESGSLDTTTYAVQAQTGVAISNQLDFANGGLTYLSRQDWLGTWPQTDGQVSAYPSTYSNPINAEDGKGYIYTKRISADDLKQLDSFDSRSPIDSTSFTDTPVYDAKNGVKLIDLRGRNYDDPLWDALLDNLTPDEIQLVITRSGYGNPDLRSISKPLALDQDAATGLTGGGTGVQYAAAMTLAQTWNKYIGEDFGIMVGNQGVSGGCNGWYAPSMNIHRSPFSGRNGEYYSEDPFVSGTFASLVSRGASSKGMVTYIKHFALNDQESHRGDMDGQWGLVTWSTEQAAREIYLKPFEMCVMNAPVTLNYVESDGNGGYVNATREFPAVSGLMTSFNRIGCTWTGGCYPLLTNILRGEWGFNGFVITDNANTGLFMDAYQMIEAGGDAKLTNEPSAARWTFDQNDKAQYHYAREALHHCLYATANSKLMSGLMPNSSFTVVLSAAQKIQIAINVVCGVLSAVLLAIIAINWLRYRKKVKKEA